MSATRIVPTEHIGIELNKRTNVPFRVVSDCPQCGRTDDVDLSNRHYLTCPVLGDPIKIGHYCDPDKSGCDCSWTTMVVLRMTLELADTRETK